MSSIGLDEPGPVELGPVELGLGSLGEATKAQAGRLWTLRLRTLKAMARLGQAWRLRLLCPPTLRRTLTVTVGALMLMWSALLNGRPAVFFGFGRRPHLSA
jgi:hypothetical protein